MPDIFIAKEKKSKRESKTSKNEIEKGKPKVSTKDKIEYPKTHKEKEKLPGHTHNPLAAYCYFPDNIAFLNQDRQEQVILLLRKHPITNVRWIITAMFLLVIPMFLPLLSFFSLLPANYQFVLSAAWYLMTLAYIFEKFLSWYFHVNIVTDERILEVDFHNLVYREMTDANIDQIQDVTVEIASPIRTTLNYGDVIIQTAAQVPKIEFEAVPQPDEVSKMLRRLRIEEEVEKLEGRVR